LRVLEGHGFSFDREWWPVTAADAPTAHWSYLYTFYLVTVYTLFGPHPLAARLIQAMIVGILHPWLAYLLAKRIFSPRPVESKKDESPSPIGRGGRGEGIPLIAAFLTAIYIYFIYYTGTLMTEPFYITAILASLYLTMRLADVRQDSILSYKLALGLGLTLAVTVLLRQLFLLFVPFLFLWLWGSWYRRTNPKLAVIANEVKQSPPSTDTPPSQPGDRSIPHRGVKNMALSSLIAIALLCVLITPFTLYNYARFDRFVLLNTNAGYAFFWGNHPIYGTHFEDILPPEWGVTYQDLIPAELRHLDEAALEKELMRRGIGFVFDDPLRYLELSISRIPAYFKFWPSPDSSVISNISRVFSFAIMLPFMVYGLCLSVRRGLTTEHWLLITFMLVYIGVHLATWALIRYRLPVDAVLLFYAALGITTILSRFPKISSALTPAS
jgi:hypothetical protein